MGKKDFSISRLILFIANIILVLCLLLSYLAAYVSPLNYGFIAFMGLAYPILFFLNIAFAVLWIILLNKYCFISIIALLINWGNFPIGMTLTQTGEIAKESGNIKIVSYNVLGFNSLWKNTEISDPSRKAIMDFIKEEDPDIVCFQEFFSHKKRFNIMDSLQKNCGYKFSSVNSYASEISGVVTMSKYPIIRFERNNFEQSGNAYTITDIVKDLDTLRFFNLHLESIRFTKHEKDFYEQMSKVDNDSLTKGGHTLYYKVNKAFKKRAKQAEFIANLISQSPYPVVVCGDFNDTPSSYAYHIISRHLKDSFKEKGTGLGVTYNGKMPAFRIDYILHDPTFEARSYEIKKSDLSDHYPVISILRKNPITQNEKK